MFFHITLQDNQKIYATKIQSRREAESFSFQYLSGTDLIETVQNPNNMTLTQNYEATRDLISSMIYKRSTTNVVIRNYSYDLLGRPISRAISRNGATQNDSFNYNSKSELISATVGGNAFSYNFDEIGNRTENLPNALNQPTIIGDFVPAFDADGNMVSLQTSTGTWSISWNSENRPIRFENAGTQTMIECNYDYLGRRFEKKVAVAGTVTSWQRYIYRGFLQIACLDCLRSAHPDIWLVLWDPTQSTGTRPLAIQKDGVYFTFGWDITKNIWEVFGQNGYIRTSYSYDPFGNVSASGDVSQPFQWSSEFYDSELALVYYNYRYYIPALGRWLSLDPIGEHGGLNQYWFLSNNPLNNSDYLGEAELRRRGLDALKMNLLIPITMFFMRLGIAIDSKKNTKIIPSNLLKSALNSLATGEVVPVHSQFFFDDGTNIGFFDDGTLRSEDENKFYYFVVRSGLDDCWLREAINQTPLQNYEALTIDIEFDDDALKDLSYSQPTLALPHGNIVPVKLVYGDNCNKWANRVLEKYDQLIKKYRE